MNELPKINTEATESTEKFVPDNIFDAYIEGNLNLPQTRLISLVLIDEVLKGNPIKLSAFIDQSLTKEQGEKLAELMHKAHSAYGIEKDRVASSIVGVNRLTLDQDEEKSLIDYRLRGLWDAVARQSVGFLISLFELLSRETFKEWPVPHFKTSVKKLEDLLNDNSHAELTKLLREVFHVIREFISTSEARMILKEYREKLRDDQMQYIEARLDFTRSFQEEFIELLVDHIQPYFPNEITRAQLLNAFNFFNR